MGRGHTGRCSGEAEDSQCIIVTHSGNVVHCVTNCGQRRGKLYIALQGRGERVIYSTTEQRRESYI